MLKQSEDRVHRRGNSLAVLQKWRNQKTNLHKFCFKLKKNQLGWSMAVEKKLSIKKEKTKNQNLFY